LNLFRFVIPAKAGIQKIFYFSDGNFKDWIPAFAGMTNLKDFFDFTPGVTLFCRSMTTKTKFYQYVVSF